MSQRRQDRRGDRADRRTPPGIYPLEPDRWRLLWHIIVTVLLLAALASTATWLLLDPARHLPLDRDDMSGHASTGRDSSRSAKLTKTGRETGVAYVEVGGGVHRDTRWHAEPTEWQLDLPGSLGRWLQQVCDDDAGGDDDENADGGADLGAVGPPTQRS